MMPSLFPVVLRVPEDIQALKGPQKVNRLSQFARQSVKKSSSLSDLPVPEFDKNSQGAPLPSQGVYWSLSHKTAMVCGVVSTQEIGIDIEQIKPVSLPLFKKIVAIEEKKLFSNVDNEQIFFRVFTAKEAVLKKTGYGIKGLSGTKIKKVIDNTHTLVEYLDKQYLIEQYYMDGHIASITTAQEQDIKWTIE